MHAEIPGRTRRARAGRWRAAAWRAVAPTMLAAAVAVPRTLGAQIIKVSDHAEPVLFGSASIGYVRLSSVDDGSTTSTWDFGSAVQYRGTLEYAIGNQASLGVAAAYTRPPMSYYDQASCVYPNPCDAHARIWYAGALFHLGGSVGAYQIVDASLGILGYAHFQTDAGVVLPPAGTDKDLAFSIGYGIGYGFSRSAQMFLVVDYQTSLHQHNGLPGGANTTGEQYTTRVGLRVGLGSKRRGM